MNTARPVVLTTIASTRSALADREGVVLVPTMGALHAGHVALVERAKQLGSPVVVSIFVNPLQFGASEDLDRYPRTLDADLDLLAGLGVDFVFAPTVDEMYPTGPSQTHVTAGGVGSLYEGRSRPGHFDGVLTVVAKLLGIVRPRHILFGQKDAQQVFLVRRMVTDLNFDVAVHTVETVREDSGLALSSRNRFLDAKEKRAALGLSRALDAAASSADQGIDAVVAAAQSALMGESLVKLDYLKVVDPDTFLPVDDHFRGPALAIIAASVGSTRLIDNETIYVS
ncbi:MAG: Pantothenate synthetase [Glaciihabitans sp.]|nr:Pantothenate synthetase [Glaciihabitans sp.]